MHETSRRYGVCHPAWMARHTPMSLGWTSRGAGTCSASGTTPARTAPPTDGSRSRLHAASPSATAGRTIRRVRRAFAMDAPGPFARILGIRVDETDALDPEDLNAVVFEGRRGRDHARQRWRIAPSSRPTANPS